MTTNDKPSRPRRWRRYALWAVTLPIALGVLLLVGLEVLIRLPGVRLALQEQIVEQVAERTGLALEIEDLRLSLLAGSLEVDGVTLGSPGEETLLAAERMQTAWRYRSLWRGPFTLKRLIVTAPTVDLGAPLPELPAATESDGTGFALSVERFQLVEGRIAGAEPRGELRSWIEEWWFENVRLEGWYDPHDLALDLASRLLWLRADGERVEVSVEGGLIGPAAGPWELSGLSLQGDGLSALLTATAGPTPEDPVEAQFELELEPHRLLPLPASEAPIAIEGRLDTGSKTARLNVKALGVPVEIASPWLTEELRQNPLLAGWRLDLDSDLTLADAETGLTGPTRLRLARRQQSWLDARIDLSYANAEDGVGAQLEARLLPDRPGRRTIATQLVLPEWAEFEGIELDRGEFEITGTDLAALRADLAALGPAVLPEGVEKSLVGALEAGGRFAGAIDGLELDLAASWRDADRAEIELRAAANADRVTVESMNGHLGERRFRARGHLDLPLPVARAEVQAEVSDLVPELPSLDLAVSLAGGVAEIEARAETSHGANPSLAAVVPLASLDSVPRVGEALAGAPLVRRGGPLRLEWEVPEAEWAEWLSELRPDLPLTGLRLGLRGSATFDPARPLFGSGRLVVEPLELVGPELAVAADGPMQLRLENGELILEAVRLATAGGVLELEAWSEIDANWRPESAVVDLIRRFRIEANGTAPLTLLEGWVDDVYTAGDLQLALSVSGTPEELNGDLRVDGLQAELRFGDPEGLRVVEPSLEILFEGERVRVARAEVGIEDSRVRASGQIPLSTLLALRDLDSESAAGPLEPLSVDWQLSEADWAPTLSRLGVTEPPDSLVVAAEGALNLDPSRPLAAQGWLEVSPLRVETDGHEVRNDGPVRLELAAGRVELVSPTLLADDQPFRVSGSVDLDRAWSSEQPIAGLIERLDLRGEGTLAAALLNPFLAGGSASGLLQIDFELAGTPEDPRGRLRLVGPDASVLYFSPYVAKIESPELDLELVDGRAQIRDGRLRLNDGDVELEGSLGLDGVDLLAAFDGLRFRLDHGLLVRTHGELRLDLDAELQGRLAGQVVVDQGSLTRPITLDRDFIADLLSPIDLTGTEASPLEQIELDLRLETRRGVRVRNNVADLAVRWNAVRVRGNLLQPVIDGRFVVEPGGRAFLFGQTIRVDRGVLTFPGQPGAEAVLDLETTSSLDDPSISRLQGEDPLALTSSQEQADLETRAIQAGWSAAAFVGEQVANRINEAVPGARFTFRPILIFGEADPGARLTIGRDFSRYVTLAASIDLRNAERQTYLMDAHDLPGLPGLVLQVFTNDEEQEGATLQHRLRFGRHRRTAPTGPTVRRVAVDEVPEVSRRALKRSLVLSKGDRASGDDLFLAEVELGEYLRRQGYPDARVEIRATPVAQREEKVDLDVSIEAGPLARFRFEGVELSRALRRSITSLYRSDFYEPVALEEMEVQTVRALRSLGYLQPTVEATVDPGTTESGQELRTVTVVMQGGEQVALESLEIRGLPEDEARFVASSFATRLQRVELAAAEAFADARLLASIRSIGYPEPRIFDRRLSDGGNQLTVELEPGPQRRFDTIGVRGSEETDTERLVRLSGLEVGDVVRRDRIAAGAMAIESDLRARGYVDARVRPRLETEGGPATERVGLVYDIEPGRVVTVADSRIDGLRSTSKRWATNVAEMESGAPLREDEVAAARSRLYETGLFTMVGSESFETEAGYTEVIFDVEERPRFSVAYGVRWDSDEATQGVVDVVDRNFLGRSITLGVRGLYQQDDWSVRLGAGVPRLFGSRAVLEVFGSYRDTFEELSDEFFTTRFDQQTVDSSLQVAYPFASHVSGRLYGRYRSVDLQVTETDEDPIFPLPPTSLEFNFKTPILGTLWTYDSRDRELVLTRGYFASLDLSGTGEFLNSDFEYVRMFGQFNLYRPFRRWAGRRLGWAQSLRLGLADSFDQELDREDRFFAGGQYSVRGYPTNSLGPVEILGDNVVRPLGGKTLLVINQELRFDLLGPVAGLVFFDLGNVWEDTAEFSSDLFKSLGIGVRAETPVGLLRLDWAFPLDRREGDPSSKVYFGFGNTF